MQVAPKSTNLRHHRAESPFSTSSWTDAGGSEINEFAPSPNEISVFDLELDRSRWLRNQRICVITERNHRFRAWWLRKKLAPKSANLRHHRVESAFSSLVDTASLQFSRHPRAKSAFSTLCNQICSTPERNQCFRPCLNAPRTPRASSFRAILKRNQRFRASAVFCSFLQGTALVSKLID